MSKVVRTSIKSAWIIIQLVVPFSIASDVLNYFGIIDSFAFLFAPFTNALELPSGVALAFAAGFFFNLYAGIAVASGLGLNAYEWTVVGTFLAICHSIPLEASVLNKVGYPINVHWVTRLANAFMGAWMVGRFANSNLRLTQVNNVVDSSHVKFLPFLVTSITSALLLAVKIVVLVTFLIMIFEIVRQRPRFKLLLDKHTYVSSLSVGGLLGITYGAGILLKDINQVKPRHKLLLLTFLTLAHGLVEETFIFGLFKADVWLILLTRTSLALMAVSLVVVILQVIDRQRRSLDTEDE